MKNLKFNHDAQSVLTFRKWGRKNYSSFLTVRKQVVISVLSVVYLLSAPVITMATVQDTSEVKMEYDLDEIEVSAQRTPALYSQVARIISVIESKEIEAAPAQSVQDLLEYVAAIDIRQRGTEGVQADVSVRGGTFDQTLILLNGINITDPQTGHHNLNLPVSLAQIERIEILEGPAARVYGPNAFSGAINIVTRQTANSEISAAVSGGSFGYFDGNLSGSFSTGKMQHMLAFNGKISDGYTNNTDFNELNGFYSNQLNTEKGTLKFQLGLSEKGFGANSFYTPKYPNQYEATKTLFTSLKWEGNGPLHLTPVVYYRRHHDRFELYRTDKYGLTNDGYNVWQNDTLPGWYSGHNYHLTNVYGANLNSWVKWAAGKTAFGVEFRREQIYSNTLGLDMDEPKDVPGEDAQFTKSDDRNTVSGFLEHAYYINKWTFTAGLMANYISGSDLGLNVFPGIDVSYNVSDAVKLYSSYNTSLRMPTFTDLYYDGPSNIGNPDLKPEKSATLEGGLKLRSKLVRGHAVVFYRHGKDIIDWVKEDPTSEIWQPQNLTEINNLGTEVQAQLLFRNEFGSHYPNIQISYLYNNVEKGNADLVSNYALDNLKHKLVGSLSEQLVKGLQLDLHFVFQDREGSYTRFENKIPVGEVSYDPFWVFDGKLSYRRKQFSVFASVNNILDKQYNDIGNVIQPGRWFKTGVIYKIGFN
ncbi:TonB-dependent receptor plug domain-containing protein [Draconibacterium mangrovi]|uniref:TonB-dependent receptor plug domain-containing protein n=1 Tax=Draconibacterium mangrovi TaxID=2697469 RepID=UPI0013D863EA|nr:TonB-dependent receptor [Draconibacterium mangrovi]